MSKLIEALQILLKYGDFRHPTYCEHDVLAICTIDPDDVTDEDKAKLEELDFFVDETDWCFKSFHYGSS